MNDNGKKPRIQVIIGVLGETPGVRREAYLCSAESSLIRTGSGKWFGYSHARRCPPTLGPISLAYLP